MPEHVVEFGSVGRPPEPDGRLDAPAFYRNQAAIWSVLAPFLERRSGHVLEIGSGTGQHAAAFAQFAPHITWWPSDSNDKHLASIAAWRAHAKLANLREPVRIDLLNRDWEAERRGLHAPFVAILCINVLHITPWQASVNLLGGASHSLTADGRLFVYGPFMLDGRHTAPSNAVADMRATAQGTGLRLIETVAMPSNNLTLVFERGSVA